MNKSQLIEAIASDIDETKVHVESFLNSFMSVVQKTLQSGDDVMLVGFGAFKVQSRNERKGHNPRTGKELKIAAKKLPVFRPGLKFKEAVNGKK